MSKIVKALVFTTSGLLLLSIGGLVFLFTQAPPLEEQIPQNSLVVNITEPQSGIVLLQGGPYTVRAEIVGPVNISAVELWANGFLVGTVEASATGGYSYQATWEWTISSPGQQTLYARAFDVEGQVVVSTPIWLTAVQTANGVGIETYLAQEGDTLAGIAENKGISLQDLQTYNASDPDSPLPAGEPVYLPESGPSPEPIGQTGGESLPGPPQPAKDAATAAPDSPNPGWLWLRSRLNKPANPPEAPLLSGEAPTCTATLYIGDQSDNEQGFLIYRYHPNSGQWAEIAAVGAHDGMGSFVYMDETALSNTGNLYMVEAFNAAGRSSSVPVEVLPGDASRCPQTEWQGIPIVNNVLVLTPVYQRVYLYLSLNNGQFQRIPADPGQYLPAVQNGYDLASYLGDAIPGENTSPDQVVFEVWGWQGGRLSRIGGGGVVGAERADFPLPVNTGELDISQYGTFSDVSLPLKETFIHLSPWELSWYGKNLPSIQGRVQVSLTPYSGAASLNPPGLLAETDINLGTFKLDFGEIFGVTPVEPTPTVGPVNANNNQGNYTLNPNIIGLFPGASSGGGQSSQGGALSGLQIGALSTSPISNFSLAANPLDLYIRVVPLQDGKIAGQPTNTVIGHYVPPGPNEEPIEIYTPVQIDPIYQTKIIKYQPPDFADPNRWGCVVVTAHDDDALSVSMNGPIYKQLFPIGKEFCPKSYSGGNTPTLGSVLGDVFNGFKSLFNFITGLYNDIKAFAIDLVMKVLPCGDLESICKAVVSAAVDYGLTAVGLPPSLPDFDQFANAAKGEMVDLIVDEALANSPVPCEGICKEQLQNAVEQTVDAAIDEMTKTSVATGCVSESEAHEHGREPLCFPDGIIVKPALHAADQPASAVVEVSLPSGTTIPADYPECRVDVGIQVSKFFQAQTWYGAGGWLKYPIDAQTVSMTPYYNKIFTVGPLAPGESATYVVVFDKVAANYYLPWTYDMYKTSQEAPNWMSDWYAAVRHGNAVMSTWSDFGMSGNLYTDTSSCATPDQVQFTMP